MAFDNIISSQNSKIANPPVLLAQSTTRTGATITLNDSVSNYRCILLVAYANASYGTVVATTIVPIEVYKATTVQCRWNDSSTSYDSYAIYVTDTTAKLYAVSNRSVAMYGIK